MNEKRYRFVPKCYGWGFMPVTWEGWLFSLLLLAAVLVGAWRNGIFDPSIEDPTMQQVASFLLDMFLVIFASLWFMDSKTKGELKRRRGSRD